MIRVCQKVLVQIIVIHVSNSVVHLSKSLNRCEYFYTPWKTVFQASESFLLKPWKSGLKAPESFFFKPQKAGFEAPESLFWSLFQSFHLIFQKFKFLMFFGSFRKHLWFLKILKAFKKFWDTSFMKLRNAVVWKLTLEILT